MSELVVIGHKNPDTDSVVSAFVWSRVLNRMGENSIPAIAGDINRETKFVFEKAGSKIPEKVNLKGRSLFLVDHNEESQMAENPKDVVGILDHHNLSPLSTSKPIFFRNEPLGSTSSLIAKIATEKDIDLEDKEMFLLLSGIISDTLKFNSPTTTPYDKQLAINLAEMIDEDIDSLAEKMFEAKSNLDGMSVREIIENDYKLYQVDEKKVGVGVAEVATTSFFSDKKDDILREMRALKKDNNLDYVLFGVIDILNQDTFLYLSSKEDIRLAEKTFDIEIDSIPVKLEGVTSRKKQIIPRLSKALKKNTNDK